MLAAAQARVAEQGLKEKVRFLGYHPYDRLISIMHASDVYVCIGTHDLLCSSILESLCTGLVPVVSPIPAYHAVIKHGVNGFFVDPVTPENVAAQVNEVLADFEQLRPRVAAYNRELTVPRFDLDASAEWTAARYREAIERRRDTGGLTKLRAALARAGAPGFGRRLK
jgi:glycosyltransferase involved in cell wall biosynthesis